MNRLPKLTLITDSQRLSSDRFFELVEAALAGGVDAVLIREKQMDSAKLLAFAARLRQITRDHHAKLLIHTQADIAEAVQADGVHLSAFEMDQIPTMRKWLNESGVTFSTSCHNQMELEFAARFGADFAFLSPVFATKSHPGSPCLGIKAFKNLAENSPLPIIALGGIDVDNRAALKGYGVAVISAILDSNAPEKAAQKLSSS